MKRMVILGLFVLVLSSCGIKVIAHDEKKAATVANNFAHAAFVSRNYPKAHGLLSEEAQRRVPLDKLAEAIINMHPSSFPTNVKATDYEPIPGQKAMNILLAGRNGNETFFYRLLMVGDAESGYRVSLLARGNGPYPSNNKRPLP